MNFYIYRKLTIAEKRMIFWSLVFFFIAGLVIFLIMPDGKELCIGDLATAQNGMVLISEHCFASITKAIVTLDKLFFISRSVLVSIIVYLGAFLLLKLLSWVNSP